MRKIAMILVGCLALTGCSGTWGAEIRLKVTKIEEEKDTGYGYLPPDTRVWLDPVGELPKDAYRRDYIGGIVEPAEIAGDVKVGDEVICLAKQRSIGFLQTNSIQTELFRCRKA